MLVGRSMRIKATRVTSRTKPTPLPRILSSILAAGVLSQSIFATAALALPEGAQILAAHDAAARDAIVDTIARKGTRAYTPDSSSTAMPDTNSTQDKTDPAADAKALQDCVAIWDEKTHISPSNWKEICKRQLKERGAQLR
jgi:hypothetical protein